MSMENIEDIYPLSPMQQGMLFHSIYSPESGEYIEQMSCKIKGQLDVDAFERAWQEVLNRHTILRTAFVWEDLDEPLQVVQSGLELKVDLQDWRSGAVNDIPKKLQEFVESERKKGFDLTEAPLMRVALIQVSDSEYHFVWSHHHLLLDGWSVPLLLEEVFSFYDTFHQGRKIEREQPRPFRDYIAWLQQQDLSKAEAFWRDKLNGFTAPTPLVMDNAVEYDEVKEDYSYVQDMLSKEVTETLQNLARTHQVTLNTFMQGAWALLLSIYSGEDDVLFGATVSGRPPELLGSETMLGIFINTLPVRIQVSPNENLLTWIKDIQKQQSELRQYEFSALTQIQGWSQVPRDMPLFESIFVFENYPVEEAMKEDNSSVNITDVESYTRTSLPITVAASPGKKLGIEILFDRKRFSTAAIKRTMSHLKRLLGEFASNADRPISELTILTEADKKLLLVDWNDTDADLPYNTCIHHLIEQQVERTPDAPAVLCCGEELSFSQLNERANQLARFLLKAGLKTEDLVGICMDRSVNVILSMLAVLKAGGAYVPIDPLYPKDRIEYMIVDSGTKFILTEEKYAGELPEFQITKIRLDSDWSKISNLEKTNLELSVQPENLAYIIYTSGSTGKPKGVMLQHGGLSNFAVAYANVFGVDSEKRVIQFFSFSFDGSVGDIYMSLISGACLCIMDGEERNPGPDMKKFIEETEITTGVLPPSVLSVLSEQGMPNMKTIGSGGDAVSSDLAERWTKDRDYHNVYGPTEATCVVTTYLTNNLNPNATVVPIGKPLGNVKIYILNSRMQPVPIGVPGEIYIGGVSLARGYLNKPDLSAESFVPNPFSQRQGNRLYKTGDLGRYLPDGNIEFLGRVDHQVKIRGFRIELGEIEENLNSHPAVQYAVVLAREDKPGDKRLVAYFVPDRKSKEQPTNNDLQEFLKKKLPDYMVPAVFVMLEEMPLSPSGKIDRKALPAPELDRSGGNEFVAPSTPTEELIAEIWAEVLEIEQIGVFDNFFELGGHSLTGVKLQSRIQDAFQIELPLNKLFEVPTVAELANLIEGEKFSQEKSEAPPIVPVSREQEIPLSFAQHRLWFLDQLEPNSPFYNIPTALRFKGNLNVSALEKAFEEIIKRHESLRTTFDSSDGKPFQVIAPSIDTPLERIDLTEKPENDREKMLKDLAFEEAQQPFDLQNGPLFRVKLVQMQTDEFAILFTMHHIISDGWSITIFVQEIAALYEAFNAGKESPLPELKVQYPDFSHWQRQWLQGEVLDAQLSYWKEKLAGSPPILELPTDRPRPAVQSFNGATLSKFLPKKMADALKKLSREEGSTLFMTLMAAFKTLLYRYTGQDDISVGTPIANRKNLETEKLIGFFVNTLVMRTDLSDDPSFLDLLHRVRETALEAYAHQDIPFETIVEAVQPERDMSHSPLFQVMFVLQEARKSDIELSDVMITPLETDSGNAKFDLTLEVLEGVEQMELAFEYNTDLFDESTIDRMSGHFLNLLETILLDPEQPVSSLHIMGDGDKYQMLTEWNETTAEFPDNACVHEVFQKLAEEKPDAVATIFENASQTYGELNEKANQLARYLQKRGVQKESFVGICMERSLEMVIGIMAALKAGGAFVPLDPAYPAERLAFMMADSNLSVLLTQEKINEFLPEHDAETVCLDNEQDTIFQGNAENLNNNIVPENLAYMIYTSGSTGKPKGTMLQHRGLCNLAMAQHQAFDVTFGSRILQFSSLSFDASVWETVMALLNGSTLCLTRRENLASGQTLWQVLKDNQISTVTLPPSVAAIIPEEPLPDLNVIITAGEKCTAELVSKWNENGRKFFNAYGPTETTVCASMLHVTEQYRQGPPIGRPINNFNLYILDKKNNPVPIGVAGELHIGGVGLARGYYNRPDLTAEKFIADPFSRTPGSRLYKSGDLARFLPDGNIEFLGRIDHQVKVRGFRIELGEIEAVLAEHADITDVIVIVREDVSGDKRLVAYLVTEAEKEMTAGDLRNYLRERLPDYMLPSAFMILEEFPLTPNGKVDRKALPAPDQSRPELGSEYVEPRNDDEKKLAEIVSELLNVEKVGVYDNFFDLGGHSLLATQFISRTRDAFEVELPLRSLFEKPTVAGLVEEITILRQSGATQSAPSIKRVSRDARRVKLSDLEK